MGRILQFWNGEIKNQEGHSLHDMIAMSDEQIEQTHTCIQWLFPLFEESRKTPGSPVLEKDEIEPFLLNHTKAYEKAFRRMMRFYGIRMSLVDGKVVFGTADDFPDRAPYWLRQKNHNFLRLTRIMQSLCILGQDRIARALQSFLLDLAESEQYSKIIGPTTAIFWVEAVPELQN